MDKEKSKARFDWLPAHMPGVASQVRAKRRLLGDAHVNECWRRGVLMCEPGWFFAREGSIAIGTPWDDLVMANFAALSVSPTQSLLCIRTPETRNGTTS